MSAGAGTAPSGRAEPAGPGDPVLTVRDLSVTFPSEAGRVRAVRGLDLDLHPGTTLGIVGESGSGKSVTSLAVMGLLPEQAAVIGSVRLGGRELLGLDESALAGVRGREIGMVFQDPLSSLTPIFTVGAQLVEALRIHSGMGKDEAWKRAVELLDLVGIPDARSRARSFPHEFSGGMRQRVMIAMAVANEPRVLIADEPTTALDVTVQAQILDVLALARRETGAAMVIITHDLGVVAGTADEVMVMYAGRAVETAPVDEVFAAPRMPYTLGLLGAVPRVDGPAGRALVPIPGAPPLLVDLPPGCPFAPRCPAAIAECTAVEPALAPIADDSGGPQDGHEDHHVACVRADEIVDGAIDDVPVFAPPVTVWPDRRPDGERAEVLGLSGVEKTFPLLKGSLLKRRVGSVYALAGVDLEVREGEAVGLVGESGSGKTTTLMEVMGLRAPEQGSIRVGGRDVAELDAAGRRTLRRDVQMVFQDPLSSLDPRMTVAGIIAEPLGAHDRVDRDTALARVRELMDLVGLDPAHLDRFPAAFSGGQRQRIGIARALATRPSLLVLDEPVSALDVSIQAGVLNLLDDLRAGLGLSYLFVAHDLSVVHHLCDRVAVMYLGRVVEAGSVTEVFTDPRHPYTRALLSAVPVPDPKIERTRERVVLVGDQPSPTEASPGCRFASRCPLRPTLADADQDRCRHETPALRAHIAGPSGHRSASHYRACHFR